MAGGRHSAEVVRYNLKVRIDRFLRLRRPERPGLGYCQAMVDACGLYRRYGIAMLLAEADRGVFFEAMRRSAELRLELLGWAKGMEREEGFARQLRRSHLDPLFDGLVTGDTRPAWAIAQASSAPFNERVEYEDDFQYARFLMELTKRDFVPGPSLEPILDRFETILEGEPCARLRICRALVAKEAGAFDEGLSALVDEHEALYAEKGEGLIADKDGFVTERFVLVEGLALKIIAATMGIAVAEEDPYMPREAFARAAAF